MQQIRDRNIKQRRLILELDNHLICTPAGPDCSKQAYKLIQDLCEVLFQSYNSSVILSVYIIIFCHPVLILIHTELISKLHKMFAVKKLLFIINEGNSSLKKLLKRRVNELLNYLAQGGPTKSFFMSHAFLYSR